MMKLNGHDSSSGSSHASNYNAKPATTVTAASKSASTTNGAADLGSLMDGLSEQERLKIASVLQRDLNMQRQDQQRVAAQKLTIAAYADDLENRNRRMAAKNQRQRPATGLILTQIERKCAICAGRLGYVKKAGLICEDCHSRICSECSRWWYLTSTRNSQSRKIRLCRLCVMQRDYTAMSGKWLQSAGTPTHKCSNDLQSSIATLVPEGQSPSASFFTTIKQCTPNMEEQLAQLDAHGNKRRQSGSMLDAGKQHIKEQFTRRRKSVTSLLDSAMPSCASPGHSRNDSPQSERRSSAGLSTKLGVVQAIRRRSCTNLNAVEGQNIISKSVKSPSVDGNAGSKVKKLFTRGRAKSAMRVPDSRSISTTDEQGERPQTPTICLISPDHSDSDDWILTMCTEMSARLIDDDNQLPPVTIHISADSNSGESDLQTQHKRNSEGHNTSPIKVTATSRRKSWTDVFKRDSNKKGKKDDRSVNTTDNREKIKEHRSEPARPKHRTITNSLCVPGHGKDGDDDEENSSDHEEQQVIVSTGQPLASGKKSGKLRSLFNRRKSSERSGLHNGAPASNGEKTEDCSESARSDADRKRERYIRRKSAY